MNEKEMRDMAAMQEEAKRRVMDMRSRSRFAADQMNRAFGGTPPEPPRREPEKKPAPAGGALQHMDREELERLFILSLCLLLSAEEADCSVILGLMYLLS